MNEFYKLGFQLAIKSAGLAGMTYDPNNAIVRKLQVQYGPEWKKFLAKQRGISPKNVLPNGYRG